MSTHYQHEKGQTIHRTLPPKIIDDKRGQELEEDLTGRLDGSPNGDVLSVEFEDTIGVSDSAELVNESDIGDDGADGPSGVSHVPEGSEDSSDDTYIAPTQVSKPMQNSRRNFMIAFHGGSPANAD